MTGTRTIFYCDNGGELSAAFQAAFWRVVEGASLRGSAYSGLGARTGQSSLDREIRDDFYAADFRVVLFSNAAADSWVLPELDGDWIRKADCLILLTTASGDLRLGDHTRTTMVSGPPEFEEAVKKRLLSMVKAHPS